MFVILSEAKNPVRLSLLLTGFFGASHLRMTKRLLFELTVQFESFIEKEVPPASIRG